MKVARLLVVSSILTCVCLLYVYQQSEIFRLAYAGHNKIVAFEDLLDKNTVLRYNIKKSGSLIFIGDKLSQAADFEMPSSYQMVRIASGQAYAQAAKSVKTNLFSRLFEVKNQAEANTVP